MIKAKIVTAMALFSAILASCGLFPGFSLNPNEVLGIPEEGSFYARNMKTGKFYIVKAELLYTGEKCVIWAEVRSGVTLEQAENIAHEYDTNIRSMIIEKFSGEDKGEDILDYANRLAGRDDRRLTILLLDIKDNFKNDNDSYYAGYFFSGDFWPKGQISNTDYYSNCRDMIYIDTNPGLKMKRNDAYATFAHELQHLVNYVTCRQKNKYNTDIWIDEGLSSQAEYFYLGEKNPGDKRAWLNDKRNNIGTGNNFFVWGNHSDKPLANLDDYATVYLFFRWLYLQADAELRPRIFRDIATSSYYDYHAVTEVAKKINPEWSDWETLLRTWLAANYYPENPYGYDDSELQEVINIKPIADRSMRLYPGEGVYSTIKDSYSVVNTGNIRYAGLAANTDVINTAPPYTENVLLTFNANANNSSMGESGSLTGNLPAASQKAANNRQVEGWNGSYIFDAQDLWRRDPKYRVP